MANQDFQDAGKGQNQGILAEFIGFMKDNSKWWLIPFLVVFGLLAVIIVLGGTGAAPFLYTLF